MRFFVCLFMCFFLHVKIIAQNNVVVTVHNKGGSGVTSHIKVHYATDQDEHKAGDEYTISESESLIVGKTRVFSLPNKNFQIGISYIGDFLFSHVRTCKVFVPTAQKCTITIGVGGEFAAKIDGIGTKEIYSKKNIDPHDNYCPFISG